MDTRSNNRDSPGDLEPPGAVQDLTGGPVQHIMTRPAPTGTSTRLTPDTAFHRLVAALVADGDHRAEQAGRRARRTLAEQMPGLVRQPVLYMTRPLTFHSEPPATPRTTDEVAEVIT